MSESSVKITKKASQLVWGASPAGTTFGGGFEPGTKDFFENVLSKRSQYEMPWLFELVPFSSFCNKEVLELGCGAGYDAYEFCCNGAKYTGIDITPENINRTRKHLNYYGYSPTLLEGDAENLSFEDKTFDAVYSLGVLHHTPDIQKSFNEAYRVLKPSGDFWVIVYHKNSIVYWLTLLLVDHWLRLGFLKRSFKERLSMVEYTTSDSLPLVNVYSRSSLKKLLNNAGFTVEGLWVRKLVHLDLPAIPLVCRLWRFVPQPLLDFVGKSFGWYVIAKAKKENNE
jgi:ubiquinone/menaquinone biosynthesis C-methylase UbiE